MEAFTIYRVIDTDNNKTIEVSRTRDEARDARKHYPGNAFIQRVVVTAATTEKVR